MRGARDPDVLRAIDHYHAGREPAALAILDELSTSLLADSPLADRLAGMNIIVEHLSRACFPRGGVRIRWYMAELALRGNLREAAAAQLALIGKFFEDHGDARCMDWYRQSLRRSREAARRATLLTWMGRAAFDIAGDAPASRRFLAAAVLISWGLEGGESLRVEAEGEAARVIRGNRQEPPVPSVAIVEFFGATDIRPFL